ncbi:MAG: DUF1844 domain-containing protein [Candidatus Acidiferrales bacterium]
MADPKQEESFKVIDRRLFTEDGALRKDVVEQEERREEEAAAREATRAATNKQAHADAAKSAGASRQQSANPSAGGLVHDFAQNQPANQPDTLADDQDTDHATDQPEGSRSFQMLVDFLVRNAAAMLGGMADPRTGQAYLDLEGAREVIDMLDALRDKTRGNLSKADDDLLIEVLGQLKLTFMEMSKVAADAMAKKAAQKK